MMKNPFPNVSLGGMQVVRMTLAPGRCLSFVFSGIVPTKDGMHAVAEYSLQLARPTALTLNLICDPVAALKDDEPIAIGEDLGSSSRANDSSRIARNEDIPERVRIAFKTGNLECNARGNTLLRTRFDRFSDDDELMYGEGHK